MRALLQGLSVLSLVANLKGSGALECGLGSGGDLSGPITTPPTGQLQDASSVRIRDASNNSPTFDSEGVVSGRIEVKPSGETA